jgi:DNA-binding NarL/FixJ family response regulator
MSIRVAIVEDDRAVRENLAILVDSAPGFACVAACASAEEAFQRLPAAMPDVVLMDINLPGRSGIECVAQLRRGASPPQIIMLTVEEDTERVFDSLKAGATGYLVKSVSTEEILEAVAEVYRGGAPMTSRIARPRGHDLSAASRQRRGRSSPLATRGGDSPTAGPRPSFQGDGR